jgi:hypothetical protein
MGTKRTRRRRKCAKVRITIFIDSKVLKYYISLDVTCPKKIIMIHTVKAKMRRNIFIINTEPIENNTTAQLIHKTYK